MKRAPTFAPPVPLACNRCDHEWAPRMEEPPKRCPGCGSPYWNKPRTRPATVRALAESSAQFAAHSVKPSKRAKRDMRTYNKREARRK